MTDDLFGTSKKKKPTQYRRNPNPENFTWLSDSKKARAKRRLKKSTPQKTSPSTWTVPGVSSLGDTYTNYYVAKEGKRHVCTCQTHAGGEFRSICTHIVAVMYHEYDSQSKGKQQWTQDEFNSQTQHTNTGSSAKSQSSSSRQTSMESSKSNATSAESLIAQLGEQLTMESSTQATPTLKSSSGEKNSSSSTEAPTENTSTQPTPLQQSTSSNTPPKRKRRKRKRPTVAEESTSTPTLSSSGQTSSTADMKTAIPVESVPGVWPSWLSEFRSLQIQAVDEIVDAFQHHDLVFLDGPTGAGKSLIAYMVAQRLGHKAVLCTQDKALQDQYLADFQEIGARTIKGRANYKPQTSYIYDNSTFQNIELTCEDCNFSSQGGCSWCDEPKQCSYRVAKEEAVNSPIAVLNYAYFIREAGSPRPQFSNQDLVIADECDVLEDILLSQAEVVYSQNLRKQLNLGQPEKLTDETGDTWLQWLRDDVLPKLEAEKARILTDHSLNQVKRKRRINYIQSKISDTELLIETMQDDGDLNWVLSGYKKDPRKKVKEGPMIFKPIRVGEYGGRLLWKHGRKFLLMSASIVSSDELVDSLGWHRSHAMVTAPMPFDPSRREIHYIPVATITHRTKEEAVPKMIQGVKSVLNHYPEHRAIVHTVSYDLTKQIESSIIKETDRQVFVYRDSSEKDFIIKRFESTPGAVLVGPTIGRGTDFKGDKARVNIICKIPYASLGDPQIKARLYTKGGNLWYATKAVRELVQSCGRTTRNEEDWSVTYILDGSLKRLLRENRNLFPQWWQDALKTGIKPARLLDGREIPKPNIS